MSQLSLLTDVETSISFDEIAKELKISSATVRNWVNTGNLIQLSPYRVCLKSYSDFKESVIGKEKLHKRANKQHIDSTDHERVKQDILSKILEYSHNNNVHALSEYYENSLGESHRNQEGIYYTPAFITEHMLNSIPEKTPSNSVFCDPCCGSGNFLIAALDAGVSPENIYGYDTDANAVAIAKARILEKTGYKNPNIQVLDFLENFDKIKKSNSFDIIFTNPPWGKKYPPELKDKYASKFNNKNKVDSSAIFALACLNLINKNGYLGLLLPDAFFNVLAYTSARKQLLQQQIISLSDYQKPFTGLQTRAQSIVIKKSSPTTSHSCLCNFDEKAGRRLQSSFENTPNSIFNFHVTEEDAEVLEHAYNIPHITLEGKARWALGIVTGNNNKYIKTFPEKGLIPVYKGSDITKEGFKTPSNYILEDFSNFQQVAPLDMYTAKEKIVYRFINSDLVFAYDNKQRHFLNSANLFILSENIGISHEQACFLLNTKFINWIFKNTFRTHKILRSDLEKLPIYIDFFKTTDIATEEKFNDYIGVTEKNGTFRLKK